jgi:hypothetical protein
MYGKMPRRPSVRITRGAGSGQHLASVLQEGRENANIDAGLGFIWRILVKHSKPRCPELNPSHNTRRQHAPTRRFLTNVRRTACCTDGSWNLSILTLQCSILAVADQRIARLLWRTNGLLVATEARRQPRGLCERKSA